MTKRDKWIVVLRAAAAFSIMIAVLVGGVIVTGSAFSGVTYAVCWLAFWAAWYLLVKMTQAEVVEWIVKPVKENQDG